MTPGEFRGIVIEVGGGIVWQMLLSWEELFPVECGRFFFLMSVPPFSLCLYPSLLFHSLSLSFSLSPPPLSLSAVLGESILANGMRAILWSAEWHLEFSTWNYTLCCLCGAHTVKFKILQIQWYSWVKPAGGGRFQTVWCNFQCKQINIRSEHV